MRVVNFGSLNIDYGYRVDSFLKPGETKSSKGMEVFCGGKGLNQSVALAKAGVEVYHIGLIGEDGKILKQEAKRFGVKTKYIKEIGAKSGHTIIQVDESGQNCILLYGGANQMFTHEYVDEILALFSSDDIVLLQNEINVTEYVINKAAEMGMRIAFNAAPVCNDIAKFPIDKVTWLLVNEVEGEVLTGKHEYDAIADGLLEKYPLCNIVLTLGDQGVMYKSAKEEFNVDAYKVNAVDTIAAGDTFTGYFLKAIIENFGASEALRIAAYAGSLCVQKTGAAESIPCFSEVTAGFKAL